MNFAEGNLCTFSSFAGHLASSLRFPSAFPQTSLLVGAENEEMIKINIDIFIKICVFVLSLSLVH